MTELTEKELSLTAKAVVVKREEDLVIYQGELDPKLSDPCDNWYLDDNPPRPAPKGLIAIRQLKTGCLAFVAKSQSDPLDVTAEVAVLGVLSIFQL